MIYQIICSVFINIYFADNVIIGYAANNIFSKMMGWEDYFNIKIHKHTLL